MFSDKDKGGGTLTFSLGGTIRDIKVIEVEIVKGQELVYDFGTGHFNLDKTMEAFPESIDKVYTIMVIIVDPCPRV